LTRRSREPNLRSVSERAGIYRHLRIVPPEGLEPPDETWLRILAQLQSRLDGQAILETNPASSEAPGPSPASESPTSESVGASPSSPEEAHVPYRISDE
jgi:hypothetical protein